MSADHVPHPGAQMLEGSWLARRLAATAGQGRYPVEPLAVALGLDPSSSGQLARVLDVDRGWLIRCKRLGITEVTADKWACRAGLHPMLVWPDWGRRAEALDDEGDLDGLEEL